MVKPSRLRHVNKTCIINFVKAHKIEAANLVPSIIGDDTLELWHRRLDHLNVKSVYILQKYDMWYKPWRIILPHILIAL